MLYAIQVNHAPWQGQGQETVHQFIKAAIARGHRIVRIFFYHDGVFNAARWVPEAVQARWLTLARTYQIDLVLCISAAQRRGVVSPDLEIDDGACSYVPEGFRVAGLGLWVDACLQADRVMVFG